MFLSRRAKERLSSAIGAHVDTGIATYAGNGFMVPVGPAVVPELWAQRDWFPVILLSIFLFVGLMIAVGALGTTVSVLRGGRPFNARTAS